MLPQDVVERPAAGPRLNRNGDPRTNLTFHIMYDLRSYEDYLDNQVRAISISWSLQQWLPAHACMHVQVFTAMHVSQLHAALYPLYKQITSTDVYYLEDIELARSLVELG